MLEGQNVVFHVDGDAGYDAIVFIEDIEVLPFVMITNGVVKET